MGRQCQWSLPKWLSSTLSRLFII